MTSPFFGTRGASPKGRNLGTVRVNRKYEIVRMDSVCRSGEQIVAHFNRTLAERVREAKEANYVESQCRSQ